MACDVRAFYYEKFGSLDETQFDFNALFGLNGNKQFINMTKRENLEYGVSVNSHSMVIVGFDEEKNDKIGKWKVENSWSQKKGNKGYVMMTDQWFDKFVYQVLIEKDK